MPADARPVIGLWGQFDVDSLDPQVRLRVAAHELSRRRPDCEIRMFAPFGAARPVAIAADLAVEPLAPCSTARLHAFAADLAAIIQIGPVEERFHYDDHPIADPREVVEAVKLLRDPPHGPAHGTDRPRDDRPGDDTCHPGLLAQRIWTYAGCEQRREFLRAMHWWPQRGAAIVVADGAGGELDDVLTRIAASGADATVIGGAPAANTRVYAMPSTRSTMEDRVAAIAGAQLLISDDAAAIALADAYGRPRLRVRDFLAGMQPPIRTLREQRTAEASLDQLYDTLATLVTGERAGPLRDGEINALRAALDARGRRLAHERVVLADYVRALRNNMTAEIAHAEERAARGRAARLLARLRHRR